MPAMSGWSRWRSNEVSSDRVRRPSDQSIGDRFQRAGGTPYGRAVAASAGAPDRLATQRHPSLTQQTRSCWASQVLAARHAFAGLCRHRNRIDVALRAVPTGMDPAEESDDELVTLGGYTNWSTIRIRTCAARARQGAPSQVPASCALCDGRVAALLAGGPECTCAWAGANMGNRMVVGTHDARGQLARRPPTGCAA